MYPNEISVLFLDNAKSTIQTEAVNRLLNCQATIIFCDKKRSPTALISNDFGHSNKVAVLRKQMELYQKVKNRLWQKIIKIKIQNQLNVIRWFITDEKQVELDFLKLINEVSEGDDSSRESVAARRYFSLCYGKEFKRGRFDDKINASLNYGYALLRAIIRKCLVSHGFEPALGIHHASVENPFNLSDDIIEPYRPFLDAIALQYIATNGKSDFEQEDRLLLIKEVLMVHCIIDDRGYTLHDAINVTVESLIKCMESNSSSGLLLPAMIEP